MGEARRRASRGLPPRQPKPSDKSSRVINWIPLTRGQTEQFMQITTWGAWIGIACLVIFWLTVRFVGPAAGWWSLSDTE